jgi:hypothetical protein
MTSDLDRRRLAQLLGMIGSTHDGEALNAARLADRHLRDRRMSWEEIILPPPPDCSEWLRSDAASRLRHADALEAWGKDHLGSAI